MKGDCDMDLRVAKDASVKDGNLAHRPLKVGQTVHLDPSNISQGKLSEEELKADYEVKHFYFKQEPVKEDPTIGMPDHMRTFSGVSIKNKKTGVSFDVNRFQLMDGQTNIIPIVGQRYRMPNLFNSTFVVTSVSNNSVTMKADKTGMVKTWDINIFESGVRQGQIVKDSKISYEDGDTSDIDKMDKYALAYKLEKYGIKVNESNPKPVAEMRRLLKEKMSQKDSKMFKVTDKNTGVVRLARAADGLDAVRKVSAVKDAGWFNSEIIKINSASEITLAKIVSDVKKAAHPKLVAEITNGRLDGNSLSLQLLVRKDFNGGFTWMEMPIMYELNFDIAKKLYLEGGFNLEKASSEIREKLKQFVGKQLYKDKTIVSDAKLGVVKD